MEDPLSHPIFHEMKPTELNKTGYKKLMMCYTNGLERMQKIFCQEVLQTETKITTGRRALGVRKMKYKDYIIQNKENKRKNKENNNQLPELAQTSHTSNQPLEQLSEQQNQPNKRKRTLSHEKQILKRLLTYKTKIPDNIFQEVEQLLGMKWNKKKIYSWWAYNIKKSPEE
ncbi:hypothetical protein Glove_48g131 [Diversispora epigaea]|uniref:Uncharacterized protein n=1 Tax=Diversispora epigaea TaxID=1348612 RepID=A0A397JNV0_9GLOM|nr:hypothetical protein Glove_48g131 [Diversispora epigaea]